MAESSGDGTRVEARILYWGVPGAGITSNLQFIHAKLRADHRGELRQIPTRLDPTVSYEMLPISLGDVNGIATRLQITAVPSDPGQTHTRKHLLDEVDGLVLVIDAQAERADDVERNLRELEASLEDYGRALQDMPFVVQYNKRDLTDDHQVEALHRRLGLQGAPVFEAIASQGRGVLKTLTTISKGVVRALRTPDAEAPAAHARTAEAAPAPVAAVDAPPRIAHQQATRVDLGPADDSGSARDLMEQAILAEGQDADEARASDAAALDAQAALDRPWEVASAEVEKATGARLGADMKIVSVGSASPAGQRAVRVPIVLGNEDGETVSLALTVSLEPLLDD